MKLIQYLNGEYNLTSYLQFVRENADKYPPNAWGFALASWHYDTRDSRCPHDSWIESISIKEITQQDSNSNSRIINISIKLLGAYHDGFIVLHYTNVRNYKMDLSQCVVRGVQLRGHGDWIVDEVLPAKERGVVHEIKFEAAGSWLIECADILYSWQPIDSHNQGTSESTTRRDAP